MCNKETRISLKPSRKTRISLKPSRKTRTKTRKPKFVSLLRLDTSPETSQQSTDEMIQQQHHHQLNLFPLHPENLVEDKDLHDDTNMAAMAYLFSSDTGATTLTGLLDSKTEDTSVARRISSEENSISPSLKYAYGGQDNEEDDGAIVRTAYLFSSDTGGPGATTLTGLLDSKTEETSVAGRISSEEDSISPPSLTYAYGGQEEEGALVRTALRNRERDASEEKWVCYSEVVEEKKTEEEVTSCAASVPDYRTNRQRLSLKLDYQEILNAWSDKGPLYIEGECPQTVPDLHDHHQIPSHDVLMDGLWIVPEKSNIKEEEVNGGGGGGDGVWKMGQREASVLRYKEKRQSRLFSKRIRYEVRKLNAEKRPRMKGRFVKRS